jgi:aminopeptidase-like protein
MHGKSDLAQKLEQYFDRLWPICRSITGNGLRQSFDILEEIIPLVKHEVPSGTQVFDWTIPKEWNIENAYIVCPDGKRIARFTDHNLHVVNYSIPVNKKLNWEELQPHLHHIPEMPDAIPYITSYYKENWGFCITHNEWKSLPREGEYHVVIESSLKPGHLTWAECVLPGETDEEVLFSTYLCHPSMANNELSGPLAQAFLYELLAAMPKRRYTYRFLFAPETIGVIAFLAERGEHLKKNLRAGYVLTCCGDGGALTYKRSKHRFSEADRAAEHVLKHHYPNHSVLEFAVGGSDERQYCSPGFNLPVGSLMRTPYQRYREYHTSLDNKSFISFPSLAETIEAYYHICCVLENNRKYVNRIAHCEPQLGKRGLYPSSVDPLFNREETHRLLHFLSFADGTKDLLDIAEWRKESALLYDDIVQKCTAANLITT